MIRMYHAGDTAQIMSLFRDTVHHVNIKDYTQEQVQAWAPCQMDEAGWSARLGRTQTLVAEEKGQVVGFASLESSGHLDLFYVHKDRQGQGIGTELLAAVEREARRQENLRLFAEISITARPFFERRGFRVIAPQNVLVRGIEFLNYRMEKAVPLRDAGS